MPIKISKSERRTLKQLREHYEIERKLSNILRKASGKERRYLYSALYDELYRRVPHHPQLTRKADRPQSRLAASRWMKLLKRFLNSESAFLEVGSGDCSLCLEVARHVRKVYAIEVSKEIAKSTCDALPQNSELIFSDGFSIPIPENSISVAYSNQLIEHLHPDDAFKQLQNIYDVLLPGGVYICSTSNRLTGPHDISQYFDGVATGFHLKEYTFTDLSTLFHKVGFSRIDTYTCVKGVYIKPPRSLVKLCEKLLSLTPFSSEKRIARTLPFRALLHIIIVGTK